MAEVEFTIRGKRYRLSREAVIRAMEGKQPKRIQTYSVNVEGVAFPAKQVLATSIGIGTGTFISTRARDILRKLDFEIVNVNEVRRSDRQDVSAFELRKRALDLAVAFESARGSTDFGAVLATADAFEQWLES